MNNFNVYLENKTTRTIDLLKSFDKLPLAKRYAESKVKGLDDFYEKIHIKNRGVLVYIFAPGLHTLKIKENRDYEKLTYSLYLSNSKDKLYLNWLDDLVSCQIWIEMQFDALQSGEKIDKNFLDFKGGQVEIYCNQEKEIIFIAKIPT